MTRILIVGGHGKVALLTTPLLAERGDEVTAVIRNPDHRAEVEAAGATARVFDVEQADLDAWVEVLEGHDALVWAAGAGGGDAARTRAVDRDAAIVSMRAAERAGVRRYVMVSYFGAGPDHGVPPENSFFAYAEAKAAADEQLRSSALDWTVLGPSGLSSDAGTGRIDVEAMEATSVPRADVAAVIAASLADPSTIGRTIRFNSGDESIPRALSAG